MNHTEESYVGEALPLWALVMFGTLHVVTSLNGVLGSVLILSALTRDRLFRTSTSTYVVFMGNLVITDLYFQLYYFPMLAVSFVLGRYPVLGEAHCVANGYLAMSCYSVFLLTLTAISGDRYLRVCHGNLHRKYVSRKTSLCACAFIWLLGCMAPLPGVMKNSLGFDTKTHVCFTKPSADASVSLPYLVAFVFSIVASGFFSCRIFFVFRASRRRVEQHSVSSSLRNSERYADRLSVGDSVRSNGRISERVGDRNNELVHDRNNERVTNMNNERFTNMNDDRVTDRNNELVNDRNNEQVTDRNNELVHNRNNDRVSDRNNEQVGDMINDRVSDRNNELVHDRNNERVSDRNNARVSDMNNERAGDRNSESVNDRNNELVNDRNTERVSDKNNDRVSDRNNEQVGDRNTERASERNNETVSDRNIESVSGRNNERGRDRNSAANLNDDLNSVRFTEEHRGSIRLPVTFQQQKTLVASDVALLRSLLVIYLCLVLFVTPGSVARGLRARIDIPNILYSFFLWLLSLNSSIDWIVYGLLHSRFRIDYKRFLFRYCMPACGESERDTTVT